MIWIAIYVVQVTHARTAGKPPAALRGREGNQ